MRVGEEVVLSYLAVYFQYTVFSECLPLAINLKKEDVGAEPRKWGFDDRKCIQLQSLLP